QMATWSASLFAFFGGGQFQGTWLAHCGTWSETMRSGVKKEIPFPSPNQFASGSYSEKAPALRTDHPCMTIVQIQQPSSAPPNLNLRLRNGNHISDPKSLCGGDIHCRAGLAHQCL